MRLFFPSVPTFIPVLGIVIVLVFPARADDLQGAQALIDRLGVQPAKPIAAANTTSNAPVYIVPVSDYVKLAAQLPPDQAGTKWAELALSLQKTDDAQGMGDTLQAQSVFTVLPGPASWPAIGEAIESHASDSGLTPSNYLRLSLLAHTLTDAEGRQWADLRKLADAPQTSTNPMDELMGSPLTQAQQLGEKLSVVAGSPDDVESFWQDILHRLEKAPAASDYYRQYLPKGLPVTDLPVGFGSSLNLPDFVTLLGPERAAPLLRQALLLPNTPIATVAGWETQRLARKVALDNIDDLKQVPWYLTETLEGAQLYEALAKKFPNDTGSERATATVYYVLALVTQGHPDEALKAAANIDTSSIESATSEASEHGWAPEVYDFLGRYLAQYPGSEGWDEYVSIAAQTNHADDALKFVQTTLARKDLSAVAQAQVLGVLYRALLANDEVDDGIAQLRALITIRKNAASGGSSPGDDYRDQLLDLNEELAKLGHVLKRPDLEKEGIAGALAAIQSFTPDPKDPGAGAMAPYQTREFALVLMEAGHPAEAEKLLFDSIAQTVGARSKGGQPGWSSLGFQSCQDDLIALATIYYQAGRWNDILTLVQKVPEWDSADLVNVAGDRASIERYSTPSLGLMVARAFAETGDLAQARTILDDVLRVDSGDDAAYQLLLKIGQGDLVAKIDALYAQDQFENRPLTWKATVLLGQGKIAEAEKACQAAITVDPSDGQSGKGDRMRVYTVMGQIKAAEGDTQQAQFFGNVIKAIRLSEDADDFFDAGLLTRAVTMYSQALGFFADAYCIQSRIARQLATLGRMDEAAVHYRRAFELMPVSFGRLESHCFGCERAFEGKTAQDIAEQTFTDMLKKDPDKPQLHYLLGYLRKEEERYAEALPEFVKAARLDPDYINAWRQITEVGQSYQLTPDLRDEAIFNLIRLDPSARHITPDFQHVRNLAKLWTVVDAADKSLPAPPASLLPIPPRQAQADGYGGVVSFSEDSGVARAPRDAILQNDIITSVMSDLR